VNDAAHRGGGDA